MDFLQHYLSLWGLSESDKIAVTPTSRVYAVSRGGQALILKIYTAHGKNCEQDGAAFLRLCAGLNAVAVYEFDENAVLMERLEGPELISYVDEGRDEEATEIIGRILKHIHRALFDSCAQNFPDMEDRFKALFRYAQQGGAPDVIVRAAGFARLLLSEVRDPVLLHGDMHHKNVMLRPGRGWCFMDPQPLIGDPAYDCANALHNPHQRPDLTENEARLLRQAEILGRALGIDPQRIIDYAFVHGCLSACWSMDDGEDEEAFSSSSLSLRASLILERHTSAG